MIDPIRTVIEFAEKYDILIDVEDAILFLANRAALLKNPSDPEAKRIARHFECVFHKAKENYSFAEFLTAPECSQDCPECNAHSDRYNVRRQARIALIPPQHIVEKCHPFLRKMWRPDYNRDGTEGIVEFMKRTQLTVERIEQMTPDELAAFA